MDCKTARLLLGIHRAELQTDEADALEIHLTGCVECDGLFRSERQLDAHLGAVVRAVPVPDGLHARLLHRLARERRAWYRRWATRGVVAAAVAASLFLVLWLCLRPVRPAVDVEDLRQDFAVSTSQDPETVKDWFQSKFHLTVNPPLQFDYRLLAHCDVTDYRNQHVPYLLFVRSRDPRSTEYAKVYLLSAGDFDLKDLVPQDNWGSGPIKLRALQDSDGGTCLVLYTSDRLESFFLPAVNQPGAHGLRRSGLVPAPFLVRVL